MVTFDIRKWQAVSNLLAQGVKYPAQQIIKNSSTLMKNETTKNLKQVIYNRSVSWKRTRDLLQSITIENKNSLYHRVYVGMPYGQIVEKGSVPHVITPTKSSVLAIPIISARTSLLTKKTTRKTNVIFVKSVNHPGTQPYPFWQPAGDTLRKQLPSIIDAQMKKWAEIQNI